MSEFNSLVKISRAQKEYQYEEVETEPVPTTDRDPELLENERIREKDPRYLAEKERIASINMEKNDSPFQHPCQNEKNTMTLVSIDKNHEIDVEIDRINRTAFINLIRVEPTARESFVKLLHVVNTYLREEKIKKVYHNVILSDWETVISKFEEFKLVRKIEGDLTPFPFVIVEMEVKDVTAGIIKAMGMNVDSHLDPEDLDKVSN
jgi:hypothetical protein